MAFQDSREPELELSQSKVRIIHPKIYSSTVLKLPSPKIAG